ncbi:MAG: type II toxin-antitoxin system HigB family toxin [Sphingobacterium hotanense]
MIILKLELLDRFKKKHASSRKGIGAWIILVRSAQWLKSQDIIDDFPTAKIISADRARFKIVGNKFRLIIEVAYKDGYVDVRFIGTHAEYDKIDAKNI